MAEIIIIDGIKPAIHGNLYHNAPNQIRRAVGRFTPTYIGPRMGTVRDAAGASWDWWETEAAIPGTPFFVVRVVPAR